MIASRRVAALVLGVAAVWLVACGPDRAATPTPPIVAAATAPPATQVASPSVAPGVVDPTVAVPATLTAVPTDAPPPTAPPPPTATTPPLVEQPASAVAVRLVADGFESPVYLTHAGDERLFVVEQAGRIQIIDGGVRRAEPFLDISDLVEDGANEQGLLGLAFHPRYRENGRFFIYFTRAGGDVVVARYEVSDDPNRANQSTAASLMTIAQPFANHNGGQLAFGPDGYLYLGVGDGGAANDPQGNGQRTDSLLGAILRISVDEGEPYGIPANNPFIGSEARNEIWAYGLRNPWRFSFDRLTGDLLVADVGQNQWEEVSLIPDGVGGLNLGWNIFEGLHCFREPCATDGLVMPIAEYAHAEGCSITGGYVYRGAAQPVLTGNYFFGDFCTGVVWRLFPDVGGGWERAEVYRGAHQITSFGEDFAGEIYLIDRRGAVLQVTAP